MKHATISQWGNSLGLRLPKHVADETGLKAGSKVKIETGEGGVITITPARSKPRYKLQDLLARVTTENRHPETEWGPAQGLEQFE